MAIRGINTKVEVQATMGASPKALTTTYATKASPCVVTVANHAYFAVNDIVVLTGMSGMVELEGIACRVSAQDTNTITLEGVDSTNFGTCTGGTMNKVLTWDTFASLQSISLPNQDSAKLDITTIHDTTKQETLGLAGAVSGTMSGLMAPLETAVVNLRTATKSSATRAFRITFENLNKAVFNADVSAGQGFDLQQNAIGTASYQLTIKKFITFYAS